jgi:hypothetical protein
VGTYLAIVSKNEKERGAGVLLVNLSFGRAGHQCLEAGPSPTNPFSPSLIIPICLLLSKSVVPSKSPGGEKALFGFHALNRGKRDLFCFIWKNIPPS